MTWKELALEIMRQPEWLTSQDVRLWDETEDEAQAWDAIELTCPTNAGEDSEEWTEDSGYYMSLCFDRKPRMYVAHLQIPLSVAFAAKDEDQARFLAETLRCDGDRLLELLKAVFKDSGTDAVHLAEVIEDDDDCSYADLTLDDEEVSKYISENTDDYK